MRLVINRIPVPGLERNVLLPSGQLIAIRRFQPVVWISISLPAVADLPLSTASFPAVIDTGFNQTLLIQDRHLEQWAGIRAADLRVFPSESAQYGGQVWRFRIADIWLRPNIAGQAEVEPQSPAYCLETHPGILVLSLSEREQRLPVLGMRALARNRVQLTAEFPTPAQGFLSIQVPD